MIRSLLLSSTQYNKQFYRTLIESHKLQWEGVVGLEVHAQLQTNSKLFSGAGTKFAELVNNQVSFFDAAIPGTLPVLNRECVRKAVLTALALNCDVQATSWFDRKHYFYADLPAGYQITQQRAPFALNGFIEFPCVKNEPHFTPYLKVSKIKQIQLEQDSGKSLHDDVAKQSLIDLNRAGIPLIEIVFEPDLKDGDEAACLLKELITILKTIKTCSCKIAEGAIRVDANISVRQKGSKILGVRTEVKNIGGMSNLMKAINFEVERQIRMSKYGKEIVNETRAWDAEKCRTVKMRDKEVEQDYRFMPEPNLPPLHLSLDGNNTKADVISVPALRETIPELPSIYRKKLIQKYNLKVGLILRLLNSRKLTDYFVHIMENHPDMNMEKVANLLVIDLLAVINKEKIDLEECVMKPVHLTELFKLFEDQIINRIILHRVLHMIIKGSERTPNEIIDTEKWYQINDQDIIEQSCRLAIEFNPERVDTYYNAKKKALKKVHFQTIMTEALNNTEGRANIKTMKQTLERLLNQEQKEDT